MIIVITNKGDAHPTPVIEHLWAKQCPVFRLNTEALLTDYEFKWWCNMNGADFYIRNIHNGLIAYGHDTISIWERRPIHPMELPYHNRKEIDEHNLKEAEGFLSFLLYYLGDKFSIGHHLYDRSAASKMWQLKTAKELDMKIPATCFSNSKANILSFAKDYEYVVVKYIEHSNIWIDDKYGYTFYAQKISSSSLANQSEEMFYQTVSFIQNYIEKQFELRVTVVGNEVFACKIDSQCMDDDKGKVDWRQGYDYGLKHEIFNLPDTVADFCRSFLSKMHLNFGCFDFIVNPDGDYIFLECNPNGQWLWIESLTGMNISTAIAECLMKGDVV
jgi:hypothetical protein